MTEGKRPAAGTPLQFGGDGGGEGAGTVAGELFVDLFEAADEVDHFAAGVGSAGGGAEVGTAAEGTVFVNEAT